MSDTNSAIAVACAFAAALGFALRICGPRHIHFVGNMFATIGWIGATCTILPKPLDKHSVLLFCALIGGAALLTCVLYKLPLRERWFAAAIAITISFRVPMHLGGETYNLLLPLYLCIGIALTNDLAQSIQYVGKKVRAEAKALDPENIGGAWRLVDLSVAATVLWASMSLMWSYQIVDGMVQMSMFILPFTALYITVRDVLLNNNAINVVRTFAYGFAAVTLICALVGIYQTITQTVWQNPKVEIANAFAPDFRTNSLFWDPNIYGRYLVAGILLALVVLTQRKIGESRRAKLLIAGVASIAGVGLWFTYSQSSMLALCSGAIILSTFLLPKRALIAFSVVTVIAAGAAFVAASHYGTLDDPGRRSVAEGGLELAAIQPMFGLGIGSFPNEYTRLAKDRGHRSPKLRASHTTPITIVSEQGLIGIGIYFALLAGCVLAATRARGDSTMLSLTQRWAFSLLVALVVHSMFYAGFYEDPLTWVAAALLAYPRK